MNKENYKAIANIINSFSWYNNEYLKNKLCKKLATYFEVEDIKEMDKRNMLERDWKPYKFNRKQFLKDCGVQE